MSSGKAVMSMESKGWTSYLTPQSATSIIDDERSSAVWLTRLVGRDMLKSCHHVLLASCERGTLPVIRPKCSLKYGNHVYAVATRRECINEVGEGLTFSLVDRLRHNDVASCSATST